MSHILYLALTFRCWSSLNALLSVTLPRLHLFFFLAPVAQTHACIWCFHLFGLLAIDCTHRLIDAVYWCDRSFIQSIVRTLSTRFTLIFISFVSCLPLKIEFSNWKSVLAHLRLLAWVNKWLACHIRSYQLYQWERQRNTFHEPLRIVSARQYHCQYNCSSARLTASVREGGTNEEASEVDNLFIHLQLMRN